MDGSFDLPMSVRDEIASQVFAKVIEQTTQLIIIVDGEGCLSFINPAVEKLLGYAFDEVVGKRPYEFIVLPEDTQFLQIALRQILQGENWSGQLSLRKKSGDIVEVAINVIPGKDSVDRSSYYMALGQDLSHEKDLQHQVEEVQRLETVGSLANGIAHHFNNILAGIAGQMELLLTMESDSPVLQDRGNKVLAATKRGQEVVEELMTFCRKTKSEQKRIDVVPILRNAHKLVSDFCSKGIEIICSIPDEAPAIMGTPDEINQMVVNLLTNAVDAVKATGRDGRVTLKLTEAGRSLGMDTEGKPAVPVRCLKITISDTGVGMNESTRKQLFDPFFTTKSRSESSGMGLTVAHTLVKRCRGMINVFSQIGKGTTFDVYIPVLPNEAIVLPSEAVEAPGRGEKILLYDVESYIRNSGKELLSELGFDVRIFESWDEIFKAKSEGARLAIVSVDGISKEDQERTQRFAHEMKGVPLIVSYPLKARLSIDELKRAYPEASDFMAKPGPAAELTEKVQAILG